MFFVVKSLKRHLEVLLVLPLSSRVSLGSAARARRTRPAGRVCAEQGLRMQVEPREYGPNLRETVQTKLREAVENTCSERYGYILKIFNVDTERLQGRIESTGMQPSRGGTATFVVNYDAVVFKPFKNEVLIGEVKSVAQQGVFCQCGPMQVFISKANLADESNGLKWFGDRTPACWMSDNEKWVVQEKTRLRIRLMGVRLSNDLSKSRSVCLCVCVCVRARSLSFPLMLQLRREKRAILRAGVSYPCVALACGCVKVQPGMTSSCSHRVHSAVGLITDDFLGNVDDDE